MSYLPYGRGTPGGWLLSGLASLTLHGGVIAALGLSVSQWFTDRPLPLARPDFQITLEQLESDTLAGLVEQLGDAAGQDAGENLDAADPNGDLTPEIPEDLVPEEVIPDSPEALDATTPDELSATDPAGEDLAAVTPDDLAADTPPPEEIAPEELAPEELAPDAAQPEDLTPEPAPEEIAPEEITPDTTAEEIAPEELQPAPPPEDVAPDEILPEEVAPEEIAPDPVSPEVTQPEDTTPVDTPEAQPVETVEAQPVEPLPEPAAPEVTELAPVEETPVDPPEVIASAPAEDPLVIAPDTASDDPLIVDDGALQGAGGTPLPTEVDPLNPIVADDALPVIPNDQVIAGTPTEVVTPDELALVTPLQPEFPATDQPETLEPAAQPPQTEEIEPVAQPPETEEIAPLPEEVVDPTPDPAPDPVDPATETVEPTEPTPDTTTDTTEEPGSDTVAALPDPPRRSGVPKRIVRRPAAPPSERDLAIGDLMQRIRARTQDNCVIALPRRDGPDGIGLALLAAEDGAMGKFADEVLVRPEDEAIRQTRTLLDARQCPVLSYIARNRDYPATRLGMRLDNAEVPSGNRVSGVLRGVGNKNLGLFLIDNNGVVQDIGRFTTESQGFVRFDIPVTRVGPMRDTKQLIVAIASPEPLDVLTARSGQRADVFFADLSNELGRLASLAIVGFDVR